MKTVREKKGILKQCLKGRISKRKLIALFVKWHIKPTLILMQKCDKKAQVKFLLMHKSTTLSREGGRSKLV